LPGPAFDRLCFVAKAHPMSISGFVVAYNRAALLGTCLRSLRFVDELIVIDKSSTDDTPRIARRHADRVITVPFSPTVEETRSLALAECRHDWIVFLDDDEMLSPAAIEFLRAPRASEAADIVSLPLRHHILGRFDERAYYWPEHHVRFFRRGAVEFGPTVHGGIQLLSDRIERIEAESPIRIEHLSHPDTAQWIERTNRYTSNANRVGIAADDATLADFAHNRIDHWLAQSRDSDRNDYQTAVALLRAIYDMVDRLKSWETQQGIDGVSQFQVRCAELNQAYDELERRTGIPAGMHPSNERGILRRLFTRRRT
jgi:glycosyltransferase involved in cell wall biosynthesis